MSRYQKEATIKKEDFRREKLPRVDFLQMKQNISQKHKELLIKLTKTRKLMKVDKNLTEDNKMMQNKTDQVSPDEIDNNLQKEKTQQKANKERERLKNILCKQYGSISNRDRLFVWSYLIGLPQNYEAFYNLSSQGIHQNYMNLRDKFPIEQETLYNRTQRMLSCLAHYCPQFAQFDFMPGLVFPFVKLIGANETFCFEVILSFLSQWGQFFFEFAPNPPVSYIKAVMDILEYHEPYLYAQLYQNIPYTQLFNALWSSLQVLLTDILKREDWLYLVDFLFSYSEQPDLLLYFIVSYLSYFKIHIVSFTSGDQLLSFFQLDHQIKIDIICNNALEIFQSTPFRLPETLHFKDNLPLNKEQYPIYNFYPKFSLDQHKKIYELIVQDELKAQQQYRTVKDFNLLQKQIFDLENYQEEQRDALLKYNKEQQDISENEQEMNSDSKSVEEQQYREEIFQEQENHMTQQQNFIGHNQEQLENQQEKESLSTENIEQRKRKMSAKDDEIIQQKTVQEKKLNELDEKSQQFIEEERDYRIYRIESNEQLRRQELQQQYSIYNIGQKNKQERQIREVQTQDYDIVLQKQEERLRILEEENRQIIIQLLEKSDKPSQISSQNNIEQGDQNTQPNFQNLKNEIEEEIRIRQELQKIYDERKKQRDEQFDQEINDQQNEYSNQNQSDLEQQQQNVNNQELDEDYQNQQEQQLYGDEEQYSPTQTYYPQEQEIYNNNGGSFQNELNNSNNYQYNQNQQNNPQLNNHYQNNFNNNYNQSSYNQAILTQPSNQNIFQQSPQNNYYSNYLQDSLNQHSSMDSGQ